MGGEQPRLQALSFLVKSLFKLCGIQKATLERPFVILGGLPFRTTELLTPVLLLSTQHMVHSLEHKNSHHNPLMEQFQAEAGHDVALSNFRKGRMAVSQYDPSHLHKRTEREKDLGSNQLKDRENKMLTFRERRSSS